MFQIILKAASTLTLNTDIHIIILAPAALKVKEEMNERGRMNQEHNPGTATRETLNPL